jgi:hypothetical protein
MLDKVGGSFAAHALIRTAHHMQHLPTSCLSGADVECIVYPNGMKEVEEKMLSLERFINIFSLEMLYPR